MFVSQFYPNEIIYDENNSPPSEDVVVNGEIKTRGHFARDYRVQPFGSVPGLTEMGIPVIPRSEWRDRIEEMERTKTRISDLLDQAGLTVLDQNGTNYCWINAPTHCIEIMRVVAGQPMVRLSPASVGCKIKNFRNQGGWGTEGLRYIIEHGLVPQNLWPPNAISRQYDTAAADAERVKYRCLEWWELKDRSLDEMMTCLFHRIPVAIGLNYWSHEVTAIDPVVADGGRFGCRINNSWGTGWSDRGRGILLEGKATPDDAVAARVVTPSDK